MDISENYETQEFDKEFLRKEGLTEVEIYAHMLQQKEFEEKCKR